MKILELPLHKRPREKLLTKGASALSETELVAILLRQGYHGKSALELATDLFHHFSLGEIANSHPHQLTKIKGIGLSQATTLVAALTLAKLSLTPHRQTVVKPADIAGLLSHLCKYQQEHVVAVYLNARNQIIHQVTVSIGTVNSALIHPREVFAPALECKASAVILVHNHPSNDAQPSEEDIIITQKLQDAGELMDITFLDHIIVTTQGWSSLKQLQLL